jgi:hypothetical protein
MGGLLIFVSKCTRNNYKIYSLIIIIITRIVTNVGCEVFKMLKMIHQTMLLPKTRFLLKNHDYF